MVVSEYKGIQGNAVRRNRKKHGTGIWLGKQWHTPERMSERVHRQVIAFAVAQNALHALITSFKCEHYGLAQFGILPGESGACQSSDETVDAIRIRFIYDSLSILEHPRCTFNKPLCLWADHNEKKHRQHCASSLSLFLPIMPHTVRWENSRNITECIRRHSKRQSGIKEDRRAIRRALRKVLNEWKLLWAGGQAEVGGAPDSHRHASQWSVWCV